MRSYEKKTGLRAFIYQPDVRAAQANCLSAALAREYRLAYD